MKDMNGSASPQHVYDVLIVGAGPVELATAIGLRKRGITNILVIEQAREFRKVGQVVDLLPNRLKPKTSCESCILNCFTTIGKGTHSLLAQPV